MPQNIYLIGVSLLLGSPFHAALAVDGPALASEFDDRLGEATDALVSMAEQPDSMTSKHFHILYVGKRKFAEQR